MLRPGEIVVDNFAGGGGASLGVERAIGRPIDVAINHDAKAVAMHRANHPHTRHLCQDVWDADPRDVAAGRPVGLAWFSPDCKHFSKAKGGKPVEKKIRGLCWVVIRWAATVKPRVIILENVEEFRTYGPLLEDGKPCPDRKGVYFKLWVHRLRQLGYAVEWRELRACDNGAPTIRKRLFLIARRDGQPITWPGPTHGPSLLPHRTAAECIDWSIPCPSIFERKRPLAEATMRRIARGIWRYVINAAEPFIVPVTHQGDDRCHGTSEPLRTITTASRGELALVAPSIVRTDMHKSNAGCAYRADEPLRTITTAPGHAVVSPTLVQTGYGEREGQAPRAPGLDKPLGTVVAGGVKHGLVAAHLQRQFGRSTGQPADEPAGTVTAGGGGKTALVSAFLAQHNTGVTGHDARKPLSTITGRGTQQQLVTGNLVKLRNNGVGQDLREPLDTVTAGGTHFAEVRAFLIKYFATATGQQLDMPLHTVTTNDRFGLVTVHGALYRIADIGMRMLSARELFRAQGFPDSYVIDPVFEGKRLTKTDQVRMCGNSVCPPLAEAVVRAALGEALPTVREETA